MGHAAPPAAVIEVEVVAAAAAKEEEEDEEEEEDASGMSHIAHFERPAMLVKVHCLHVDIATFRRRCFAEPRRRRAHE